MLIMRNDEDSVVGDYGPRDVRNPESEGDDWNDHSRMVEDEPNETPLIALANVPEGVAIPEGDAPGSGQVVAPPCTRCRYRHREYDPAEWTRDSDGPGRKLRPNPAQRLQYGYIFGPK